MSLSRLFKNLLGSSSSESDFLKDEALFNDSHVNQLNFPGNSNTYQFNKKDLQRQKTICTQEDTSIEHFVFRPLNFPIAIKTLQISLNQKRVNEERLKTLIEEAKILRKTSHCPNIIDFFGYALTKKQVWIFMELIEVSLEDLYKYFHKKLYPESRISKEIVIPEDVVGVIAARILDALAFCSKQGVMHRDVKPRHVLINKKGEVKLCGFGSSKILESTSRTSSFRGTLPYIPPERFKYNQPYDDRTDIWSLGITLVEIVYGDIPYDFKGLHLPNDFTKIADIIKNADDNKIMSQCFNEKYSRKLLSFTKSCLNELSSRSRYPELMETNLYKSVVAYDDNENIMRSFMEIYLKSLNIEKNSNEKRRTPYDYYSRENLQKALENFEEAIADYTKTNELKPTDAFAYCSREDRQKELRYYNEAIADYTKAIELDPIDADAYYRRGIAQGQLEKYNEAIADYTKTIELKPNYADAYYRRGDLQKELGNYNKAIADYTKTIELDPTYADAYYNRGVAQGQLGKYNEAIADYTKAIKLKPNYADAYYRRGDLQNKSNKGNYNQAIADYTKTIELDPTYADAYYRRGNLQKALENYEEAIADYTKAIELKPTDAYAYYRRGDLQKELENYNEAIADYTKAIELDPTYADAYYNRGVAQGQLGKYNEAIADYIKAIELKPTDAYAYYRRGDLQKELENYNEAIADCTKAIELDQTDANAYYRRENLQKELRNYKKAIADFTKAIELNPTHTNADSDRIIVQGILKFSEAIPEYTDYRLYQTKVIDLVLTQESTSSLERVNSKTSLLLSQKEEQEMSLAKPKEFSHDSLIPDSYIYEVFDNAHLNKFAIPTQHYRLSDHFTCEETLFAGNHVVKKFVHKQTETQVAIKFINIPKDRTATGEIKAQLQKLKGEIDILQALSPSKLVTELYGYSIQDGQLLIYMEFMDMSLDELYVLAHKKLSSFPEALLDLVAINGLDALIYLKSKKIMHRDVKPKNILANKSGQIKLCDFGTSKLVNNSVATTWTGTDAYLPPEAFTDGNEKFDVRREVWALGLTIAEVAFGEYPIGEGKLTDRYYISTCIKKATSEEIIWKSMQNFDNDIKEFAGLCLQELENRPKYEPLKETQLYKKYLGRDRIQLFKETLENFNLF